MDNRSLFVTPTSSSILEINMLICGTRYVSYRKVQVAISLFTFLEYLLGDFSLTPYDRNLYFLQFHWFV